MFSFNFVNKPDFTYNIEIINKIFEEISRVVEKKQTWMLNIVFLEDDEVKKLNNDYRWIDKNTDVLSFHYFENFENFEEYDIVWEIILNQNKIYSQSEEYNISPEKEFYNLIIHSVLHILWFDHEYEKDYEIMYSFEEKIWENIFNEKKV